MLEFCILVLGKWDFGLQNRNYTVSPHSPYLLPWCGYRILMKGVQDVNRQRWFPVGKSGGFLSWKMLKIDVLRNGIFRHSEAKSSCYYVSYF